LPGKLDGFGQAEMIHTTTDSSISGLFRLLDTAGLLDRLGNTALVLIKPNLVEARPPPITTSVDLVEGLPEILAEAFLLSVPVLKAHSMAGVTLTMKNMLGCVPPAHYRVGNSWGKSAFHVDLDQAIYALNSYRHADFSLLDATVGMAEAHLWGPTCQPAPGILAAGSDPVALDSYGTGLLGRDWAEIGHIRLAHGHLGQAEPLAIVPG
jgi:uncharacterized protein (DUF362 family)